MLKAVVAGAVAALIATAAFAQTAAPPAPQPDIPFASKAEVQALIAKAKAGRAADQPMGPPQPLVRGGGYRALIEYRAAPTVPQIHDNEGELFVVLEGSGTLILGGELQGAVHNTPTNQRGTSITGGKSYALAPGDYLFAPPGTAHHFAQIGPQGLSVVTMHVPAK